MTKQFAVALLLAVTAAAAVRATGSPPVPPESSSPATRGDRPGERGERGERGGEGGELRARVQQKIQTYLTVELSARAGLDEKKSLQLSGAIKAHMERKQHARAGKKAELQKLRALVDSKGADAAIKAQITAVADQSQREEQLQQLIEDTGKFLTPTEQARIIIALPDVMKDTMSMIREARGGERAGKRGEGHGGKGTRGGDDSDD